MVAEVVGLVLTGLGLAGDAYRDRKEGVRLTHRATMDTPRRTLVVDITNKGKSDGQLSGLHVVTKKGDQPVVVEAVGRPETVPTQNRAVPKKSTIRLVVRRADGEQFPFGCQLSVKYGHRKNQQLKKIDYNENLIWPDDTESTPI